MLTHDSFNVFLDLDLGENTTELVAQMNGIFQAGNNVSTGHPWIDRLLRDMFDDGDLDEATIETLLDQLHDPDVCAMLVAHLDQGEHYSEFDPYTQDDPIYNFEEYSYQLAEDMLASSNNSEFLLRYFDHAAFQRDFEFDYYQLEVTSPFFPSFDVWFSNH